MKLSKKILSVVLATVMVILSVTVGVLAEGPDGKAVNEISFGIFSDLHYYPESLTVDADGNKTDVWIEKSRYDSKQYEESEDIILTALETFKVRAEEKGMDYIIVPGDLTKDGEYLAHTGLAELLKNFEKESGIQIIVTPGNHDINSTKATQYINNVEEAARAIKADEFCEVYYELGFDLASDFYGVSFNNGNAVVEEKLNALTFTVDLDEKTQLIVVDSNIYSFDEPKSVTEGEISKECLEWIGNKADKATAEGKANIVMLHHPIAKHVECQPATISAFILNNYMEASEFFADHNIHFAYTGHLHQTDIAMLTSDDGNVIYDAEAGGLTSFPNRYRESTLTLYENGECKMDYDEIDFDAEAQYVHNGKAYKQGEFKKESFATYFGGGLNEDGRYAPSAVGFVKNMVYRYLLPMTKDIKAEGGILEFLKLKGIDLQQILADFLAPYIKDGIYVNGYSVLSAENIMWFVEDLCNQIETLYLDDPDALWEALEPAVEKIVNYQISDVPCDALYDEVGIGDPNRPGTIEDLAFSAVYYFYTGNEDSENNAFMQDARKKLLDTDVTRGLFDTIVDAVYNDILYGIILDKLEIRADKFYNDSKPSQKAAECLNNLLSKFLRNDFTYGNLVDTVFGFGILPYKDLFDVLDQLAIQAYWTKSQDEIIGEELLFYINDLSTDTNPQYKGDYGVSYTTHNQADKMEVTQKNFRLPTMINATLGENATSANINWFSKSTLTDTDIEIYEGKNGTFTGTITTEGKMVDRYYPGVDLGFIGFFKDEFEMYQHTARLSNLKPATTYTYRVGNAERGWWSDWRTITTPDGSDNVTFFHMADPQAMTADQYEKGWANTIEQAFKLYPEAAFIMNTGDISDHGNNNDMWQHIFDIPEELGNTYLMPTTGNHEGMDDYTIASNFVLPNVPEQDEASGTYYSFDYNNLHIAVLNTNDIAEDDSLSDEQIEWLKNDMKSSDAEWKIVSLHKALYSNGSHYKDSEVVAMREELSILMPELDIDLVLQGHDHVYLRTKSIRNNEVVDEKVTYLSYNGEKYKTLVEPVGTTYEISGCCGVKYYQTKGEDVTDNYFPRADKIYDAYNSMFSAIQIVDGVMYFNAYIVDGDKTTCVDSFAIQKDVTQGEELPESEWPEEEAEDKDSIFDWLKEALEILKKVFSVIINIYKMYFA